MNADDRAALAEQYADSANLDARIALHERYDTGDRDWWDWVLDRYDLPDDADVLELGCGTGSLWHDTADRIPDGWDLLLTDFSAGMVEEARAALAEAGVDAAFGLAAAESIPLADDSVDAVVANHTLYHVDCDAALPEIERVLRPGGRLYATTNGEDNLRELRDMLEAVSTYEPPSVTGFSLQSGGDRLADHFERVERHERETSLRVTDLEPLVAYAASLPDIGEQQAAAFADLAADRLADGPVSIRKEMGLFVAETADDR